MGSYKHTNGSLQGDWKLSLAIYTVVAVQIAMGSQKYTSILKHTGTPKHIVFNSAVTNAVQVAMGSQNHTIMLKHVVVVASQTILPVITAVQVAMGSGKHISILINPFDGHCITNVSNCYDCCAGGHGQSEAHQHIKAC